MNVIPIYSDDPKIEQVGRILEGITKSESNAVIFEDTPAVWFQFFLGLYLEKPTFVLIRKIDLNSAIDWQLNRLSVKKVVVEEFNADAMGEFYTAIKTWVTK